MRIAIDIIGAAISAVGLVLSVVTLFATGDPVVFVLALGLCLIAVGALALSFVSIQLLHKREQRSQRASAWAGAMPKLSQALQHLGESVAPIETAESAERDFQNHADRACFALAAAYSQVTGRECRVTLVETWYPPGNTTNNSAAVKRLSSSGKTVVAESVDLISENTDFDEIFKGATYFFCNDLAAELANGYRNSHWTRESLTEMARTKRYPYLSTIVWPVQAAVSIDAGKKALDTVGFLCVDCADSNAFEDTIDVVAGELVARAFYPVWPRGRMQIDSPMERKPES